MSELQLTPIVQGIVQKQVEEIQQFRTELAKAKEAITQDGNAFTSFKRWNADCLKQFEERRQNYEAIVREVTDCIACLQDVQEIPIAKREEIRNRLKKIQDILIPPKVECSAPV